jgi:hypothetical protein
LTWPVGALLCMLPSWVQVSLAADKESNEVVTV